MLGVIPEGHAPEHEQRADQPGSIVGVRIGQVGEVAPAHPSGVVGKVSEVHAPGEYLSSRKAESGDRLGEEGTLTQGCDLGERYITIAVLAFEDGNVFLADPKNFLILSEGDHQVFLAMSKGLLDLCFGVLKSAGDLASLGSTPESIAAVMRAALQAQLRALAPR